MFASTSCENILQQGVRISGAVTNGRAGGWQDTTALGWKIPFQLID
jgi:hypothetical protein